jgi:hypothetical protein
LHLWILGRRSKVAAPILFRDAIGRSYLGGLADLRCCWIGALVFLHHASSGRGAIAREREALAQVRASVNSSQVSIEDQMRVVEAETAETRHKALNEFHGGVPGAGAPLRS